MLLGEMAIILAFLWWNWYSFCVIWISVLLFSFWLWFTVTVENSWECDYRL